MGHIAESLSFDAQPSLTLEALETLKMGYTMAQMLNACD